MDWQPIVKSIEPFIVKIETQAGHGTGFICFKNDFAYGVATAAHVVDAAEQWHQPVRVKHFASGTHIFFNENQRIIFIDRSRDSAILLIPHSDLVVPHSLINLLPPNSPIAIGNEVGWLGFPGIAHDTLCFFNGSVSARLEPRMAYFIDGVAINGVSGGPVIYSDPAHGAQIVGIVSAYHANRQTEGVLPGLLIAQDVSQFHAMINHVKSMDDAKAEKQRNEQHGNGEQGVGADSRQRPAE
jgi:hypothetical protein